MFLRYSKNWLCLTSKLGLPATPGYHKHIITHSRIHMSSSMVECVKYVFSEYYIHVIGKTRTAEYNRQLCYWICKVVGGINWDWYNQQCPLECEDACPCMAYFCTKETSPPSTTQHTRCVFMYCLHKSTRVHLNHNNKHVCTQDLTICKYIDYVLHVCYCCDWNRPTGSHLHDFSPCKWWSIVDTTFTYFIFALIY